MAFQSLYRRFRPQRFADVRGQDHVSNTLRNAVRDNRVSHAYLFSGPRGTGKTSSARILAKALNCANTLDGEPCGVCTSCTEIAEGRSLDVVELDAASNRGVDAMRDLVSRSNLGTPGRWKVYIVDEVHMLTTEASNTLLKTLEEPPGHVIFVLATTEPQKVLPTIRSRTQHFEFRLLSTDVLADHLRWVAHEAGLDVPDEVIELVAKRGAGSARDALSKLDQVAAAGGIDDAGPSTDELMEALCEHDVGRALAAVAERVGAGHDPRHLAVELLERLRQAFLATVARNLVGLPDEDLARVEAQIARLGRAAAVRAMEVLGEALVAMRDAPDPRVLLEVSLVRLCRPESDVSPAALLQRIERLERAIAAGAGAGAGTSSPAAPPAERTPPPPRDRPAAAAPPSAPAPASPAAGARLALGGVAPKPGGRAVPSPATASSSPPAGAAAPPAAAPPPPAAPPAGETAPFPTRDEITLAWGDSVFGSLSQKAKVRVREGRFVDVGDGVAGFALPTAIHLQRCTDVQRDIETALS
ncbi:MAG: polymerase subunit gamma/tau, partial [Actinomycetota bacterium]|nr:polymerase subunit gamma/tau [Actinomycetota bacterium]